MNLFDLHCDTVYECLKQQKQLSQNDLHLDLHRGCRYPNWVQTFAFWVPDDLSEDQQYAFYCRERDLFRRFAAQTDRLTPFDGVPITETCNYLLAVEGAGLLADRIDRLTTLKDDGITFLTLTWNRANRIGGGALSSERLTAFGRSVIAEAERLGIVLDVSHLNRESFWDFCQVAQKPFVATHSNADTLCPHPRNLTRSQICEVVARGGLIGLNLYPTFLSPRADCQIEDFLRQIEYFLEMGAGECLAIGTDFDGASMPNWINGIESLEILAGFVVKWFGEPICNRIFFENANRFYRRVVIGA